MYEVDEELKEPEHQNATGRNLIKKSPNSEKIKFGYETRKSPFTKSMFKKENINLEDSSVNAMSGIDEIFVENEQKFRPSSNEKMEQVKNDSDNSKNSENHKNYKPSLQMNLR